jgi:hypothetical protein
LTERLCIIVEGRDMDGSRFDQLARDLASRRSRRSVMKTAAAAAVAAVAGWNSVAAKKGGSGGSGSTACANDPTVCTDGLVCCTSGKGSRCMSVDKCKGDLICPDGYGNCNGDITDGCEIDLMTDGNNCGACGNRCDDGDACTTDTCVDGGCVHTPATPVDCVVSDWSDWSACSPECGGTGTRTRTRTVVTEASCGGAACPPLSEEEPCGTCPDTAACLDGACFTKYPYCSTGRFGVVANGGGVNACVCGAISNQVCTTTGECPTDQVCILTPSGGVYVGYCAVGCPA